MKNPLILTNRIVRTAFVDKINPGIIIAGIQVEIPDIIGRYEIYSFDNTLDWPKVTQYHKGGLRSTVI